MLNRETGSFEPELLWNFICLFLKIGNLLWKLCFDSFKRFEKLLTLASALNYIAWTWNNSDLNLWNRRMLTGLENNGYRLLNLRIKPLKWFQVLDSWFKMNSGNFRFEDKWFQSKLLEEIWFWFERNFRFDLVLVLKMIISVCRFLVWKWFQFWFEKIISDLVWRRFRFE